jgi:hypothetical protein
MFRYTTIVRRAHKMKRVRRIGREPRPEWTEKPCITTVLPTSFDAHPHPRRKLISDYGCGNDTTYYEFSVQKIEIVLLRAE